MRQSDGSSQGRQNALKCEVAAEILRCFGSLRLQVTGHSMLPSVWPGDVLLIERCDLGQISRGEIVLYAREGRLFAHRVICAAPDREKPRFITQGDALPTQDFPITAEELVGRVSQIVRPGKCGAPASTVTFKNKIVALAARHSTVFARLLVHLYVTRGNLRNRETLCQS
jgi:signal peptidase I